MTEQVNHPRHYNARKDGLECIDIIRHYTFDIGCAIKYLWRAGVKVEMGKSNREKEIEDMRKALFYINDYCGHNLGIYANEIHAVDLMAYVRTITGYSIQEISGSYADGETSASIYPPTVTTALLALLTVGLTVNGYCYIVPDWRSRLETAKGAILKRIEKLKATTDY